MDSQHRADGRMKLLATFSVCLSASSVEASSGASPVHNRHVNARFAEFAHGFLHHGFHGGLVAPGLGARVW